MVGHTNEDEGLIGNLNDLSEYNNDEEYYESYDDYEDGDNEDYYEDYEDEEGEKGDGTGDNSYYDYDYLEEKEENKNQEEYEYYREESDSVLKLNKETDNDYYEDYYEEEKDGAEANLEDYYEDDYYDADATDDTQDQVTPENEVQSTTEKMNEVIHTSTQLVSDDEDLTEGSGFEDDADYHSFSTISTTKKLPTTVSTTTTTSSTTTASTTITTTTTMTTTAATTTTSTTTTEASGEYYFEEDENELHQETYYENTIDTHYEDYDFSQKSKTTVAPIPGMVTEHTFIDSVEGSGTSVEDNTPNFSSDISDDEDLVEGSGADVFDDDAVTVENNSVVEKESPKEELSEAETRKRSEFFELHGLDLLSLDMSCMQNFVSGNNSY